MVCAASMVGAPCAVFVERAEFPVGSGGRLCETPAGAPGA